LQVGAPEKTILPDASQCTDLPEVVNDLDWDFMPDEQTDVGKAADNRTKLEEKVRHPCQHIRCRIGALTLFRCMSKNAVQIKNVQVVTINEPRPGKKLLVLDLDYTLLDFKVSIQLPWRAPKKSAAK
jgi:ubiquitin-like domain-containing CTD phosphatase 1